VAVIPLAIFLLACAAIYVGTIEAAFSALMRLSLRISAERSGRPGALSAYLDEPVLLFIPLRLLLGVLTASATALLAAAIGVNGPHKLLIVILFIAVFVVVCEQLVPFLIIRKEPERVLEWLLPTFRPIARALEPISRWTLRAAPPARRAIAGTAPASEANEESAEVATAYLDAGEQEGLIEGEERRLLQSIVDFGDTLAREVMTPRPDIVAIRDDATVGDLRALFREQEYSRFPAYKDSLDNISGFMFVKDLVAVEMRDDTGPITPFLRPAAFVPESKRVSELLKQFQRQQTQIAIVVDEYGGTAGLVTIEDMLEEIVGEIRDEYDVESEAVVDEGGGRYIFSGKADIDEVSQRLGVQIEREGFETVGGFLLTRIGRVPAVGEHFEIEGLSIEVLDVERRRIHKVRIMAAPVAKVVETEREATPITKSR
jgi:CBS domain containing-hemolysin-like protein